MRTMLNDISSWKTGREICATIINSAADCRILLKFGKWHLVFGNMRLLRKSALQGDTRIATGKRKFRRIEGQAECNPRGDTTNVECSWMNVFVNANKMKKKTCMYVCVWSAVGRCRANDDITGRSIHCYECTSAVPTCSNSEFVPTGTPTVAKCHCCKVNLPIFVVPITLERVNSTVVELHIITRIIVSPELSFAEVTTFCGRREMCVFNSVKKVMVLRCDCLFIWLLAILHENYWSIFMKILRQIIFRHGRCR